MPNQGEVASLTPARSSANVGPAAGGGAAAASHDADSAELLRLQGITKRFVGVLALSQVDFDLRRAEVHAVCGENGAGKSTLMKVISGQFPPDEGTVQFKGRIRHFGSAREAEADGIAIIHQELNLAPHLSVAENIYLAREPHRCWFIDRKRLRADAQLCLNRLGVAIRPDAAVRGLSVAQRQMVEIAKALSVNAEVLIMDEPTSSLTESETGQLFKVIRELKNDGVAVVYISHRLDEVAQIADRVTVLRDGRRISTQRFAQTSVGAIVEQMVGRSLENKFPSRTTAPTSDVLLKVRGLTRKNVFRDVSFDLRRGEILGFAGLLGAGRTEVARAIFGADPVDAGSIEINDRAIVVRSPKEAIDHGIAYLPEDRKSHGLALNLSVVKNVTLANMAAVSSRLGFVRFKQEDEVAGRYVRSLSIRTPSIHQTARHLSGGNQQKVVIGKWLFRDSRVVFFDEPTRGIDVGAKFSIYTLLDDLAAHGIGVVLISSELPEVLGMSDRVAVFHEGRLATILDARATSPAEIMHFASGRQNGIP